jgi:hypothetical protein
VAVLVVLVDVLVVLGGVDDVVVAGACVVAVVVLATVAVGLAAGRFL